MSTQGSRDFRPRFHYTPPKGWINDPNGPLYEDGIWHLFAQHYPHDTVWGPMHWIHATSKDLLNWENQGIALSPDERLGLIFSGSAVIDKGNTSGLGRERDPMICMYTHHGEHEQQSIAFSEDRMHFTPYEGNPVIPNSDLPDFRDPKVFRNDLLGCWSVVIAAGDHVEFHASPDLLHWHKTGEFGQAENKLGGVFECPDLFPLPAPDGSVLWVLIASMALPREFGGSRTQYFLGMFDGNTFVETHPSLRAKLIDSGYDNYAAVTFSGAEKPCIIGWGTSWNYAAEEPTGPFCGLMTYARNLALVQTVEGLRLSSAPIVPTFLLCEVPGAASRQPGQQPTVETALPGEQFCLRIEAKGPFCASLFNAQGETFVVGLDNEKRFFTVRTQAGSRDFSELYRAGLASVTVTPRLQTGDIALTLYFDRCIAEVFADEGTYANTALLFPSKPYTHARLLGEGTLYVGTVQA